MRGRGVRLLSNFDVIQDEAEENEALEVEKLTMERQENYHSGACLLFLAFLHQSFFATLADFALWAASSYGPRSMWKKPTRNHNKCRASVLSLPPDYNQCQYKYEYQEEDGQQHTWFPNNGSGYHITGREFDSDVEFTTLHECQWRCVLGGMHKMSAMRSNKMSCCKNEYVWMAFYRHTAASFTMPSKRMYRFP